ncbi:MAG: hypothetical protein PCFJNLEI_02327 [Verrucomicrobiae bacterium]|nr:hypothetical protein [Verrucomicrobiae bacterium]
MIHLRVQPDGPKNLRITGIDPVVLDSLFALPEILELRDKPAARDRLLPVPTADNEALNADWQQNVTPDLRHLFVTASETVLRDLTGVEPDPRAKQLQQLTFPAEHLNAWLSAVNQARLILGELHHVTEADMANADFNLAEPRDLALLRIHVLGYLLEYLVKISGSDETSL